MKHLRFGTSHRSIWFHNYFRSFELWDIWHFSVIESEINCDVSLFWCHSFFFFYSAVQICNRTEWEISLSSALRIWFSWCSLLFYLSFSHLKEAALQAELTSESTVWTDISLSSQSLSTSWILVLSSTWYWNRCFAQFF